MRHWSWVLLFCSVAAVAETQYWVAVGSYQERANAENARDEASTRMAETFHITPADTPSGYYYRVLAGPYLTQSIADLMVTQAQNVGFHSAWLLASEVEGFSSSFDGDLDDFDDLPPLPDLPVRAREPPIKSYEPPARETPPGYQLNRLRRDAQARLPETGATTATIALRFDPNDPITLRRYPHQQANINIDGHLIEAPWSEIVGIGDFRVVEPDSLAAPRYRTVFKAFYTTRGLYMAWDMEQPADTLGDHDRRSSACNRSSCE